MKIAIFVDKFPVLSQTFVLNQITGLIDLGIDVSIVSLNQADSSQMLHPVVIQYNLIERTIYLNKESTKTYKKLANRIINTCIALLTPNKSKTLFKSFSKKFGGHGKSLLLSTILAKQNVPICVDVILCHFGYNGILANKLRQLGVLEGKIATIFHGYEISAYNALKHHKKDYQALFKNTELMLPISNLWQDRLIELGCPVDKINVHRMGVDLHCFSFKENRHSAIKSCSNNNNVTNSTIFTLFTVARFTEKKGLEYAIKAIALLPRDFNVHYIIAGYGELETELRALVEKLEVPDRVEFIGALNQSDVTRHMHSCDAFIQPSITAINGDMEGVPVTLMEAMAVGLPVISTYHSGIPELIVNGDSGLLSPEKNAISLKDNIELLIKDNSLRNKLRINARRQIENIADVSKLNLQLVNLLKGLNRT